MGIFFLFVVLFCVLAMGVLAITAGWSSIAKLGPQSLLDRIATRYRASVHRRGGERYVLIRIAKRLYHTKVQLGGDSRTRPFLSISANWSDQNYLETLRNKRKGETTFRMSITPESLSKRKSGLLNTTDIRIGDDRFDNRFFIQSNDSELIPEMLTSQAQELITKLFRQSYSEIFELRVVDNQLQLDQGVDPGNPQKAFTIIRLFAELHVLLTHAAEAAQEIDIEAIVLKGDATCLICGEEVTDRNVNCRSCRTEYHRECWEYIGKCGRYACGGTQFDAIPQDRASGPYQRQDESDTVHRIE